MAAEQALRLDETEAGAAVAFTADTAVLARGQRPDAWRSSDAPALSGLNPAAIAANLGFVVAHGAGLAASACGALYDVGVADERASQVDWLVERLELDHATVATSPATTAS